MAISLLSTFLRLHTVPCYYYVMKISFTLVGDSPFYMSMMFDFIPRAVSAPVGGAQRMYL